MPPIRSRGGTFWAVWWGGVSFSTSTNRAFNYNKWWATCHGLRKGRPPSTSRAVESCWLYVDFSADKITNEPVAETHRSPARHPPQRLGNHRRRLRIVESYRFLRIPPSARRI
jgi:hypothetical protein